MKKLKIKKIFPYKGKVFDLRIKNDPSYNTEGLIVHNSGAGSLVNYLLKLTDVDPLRYNLLFSRFLNEGRLWKEKEIEKNGEKIKVKVPGSLPDIDTDTPGEQRPRIKEYMEQRFGTSQVCSVGTYTTLQLKAALTDLSKLYNISIPTIRSISKKINGLDDKTIEDFFRVACKDGEVKSFVEKYPELINVISLVLGQPKASSIHACAMMIFPKEKAMHEWVPIHKQKARTTDTDMIVTDWEGSELDEAGFLKEDILGIEQLDKFADILALIKQHTGEEIDLSKIPLDDVKVFKYFKRGWLNDVFHFGAKGLSGYVVKVQPESIDDLGICAALYRPGPMENNFHNEFLLRRSGEREIDYPIGAEHILEKSYGLMCFQEDLIRMVQDLAGFTEAQGDEVRKCIDGDELFWTTEGAVKIKDLKFLPVKPKVTTLGKDFSVKYNSVNRSFSQGTKDCIRINIQGNSSLVCTPDHKILTEIGWLEAKDCVGHYVYKDLTRRYGTLKKPKEELYLMVALLTEGSLSKRNHCSFVNKDKREIDEFKRCYFEVFGTQLKEYFNSKTGCISLNVSSKNIEKLGLKHVSSELKELPDYVFSLDKDCQEFIIAKMIDFDGYIANKKGGFLFGYSSKSSSLIKQMEILFSCLGIVTTTNRRSFKDYPDNYFDIGSTDIVDCLKIKEAVERYSFKFKEFNFTLDDFDLETTSSYKIPFEIWQPIVSNLIDCSGYTCNELLGCNVLNYGINHKINITKNRLNKILQRCGRSKFLETCIKGDFCFRLVESIESVGPREVYDFSMEYGCVPQAFVGGILVHNCIGKKLVDKIKTIEPRFVEGYIKNYSSQGVTDQYAKDLWKQMEEFGKYSFNACLSGRETIYRHSIGKRFNPTIEEMFKIKNDCVYAKITGHKELHSKYKNKGYGCSWTLYEDGKIRKTQIKDIRYAGYRQTFKIVLETGQSIVVTDNHKFPTQRGKVETKDLIVGEDYLFVNKGYIQENNFFAFTSNIGKEENKKIKGTRFEYQGINSEKGKEGFQKRNTPYTQLKQNEFILRSKYNRCQLCEKECDRLEIHHKDGDHGNNDMSNLILICPSCHKKIHYKQFSRNKIGEKGLLSGLVRIISIEPDRMEDVYDVEIDDPNHNFVTKEGIVTCNSHAISYSINGYTSMWLKVHYPIEFWAVTFSRASADDYPFYINEIKQSGEIEIKPVDINVSEAQIVSDRENNSMYWALNSVTQLGEKAQEQLMEDRKLNGPYFSFDEFIDRVATKGSAINKSVIENLIYSGAFDQLENLGDVRDRERLLLRFRDLKRIKIDVTKDGYSIAKTTGKVRERWWWQLQQKKISGYGFFDYKDLIKKYLYKTTNNDQYNTIYDGNDLKQELPNAGKRVSVGGYCIDVIVKRCKQGLFATLMLENNYEFIEVTVFSDIYDQYSEFIDSLKKSIVLLNGIATWNNYRDKNIVQTTEETYFVKLSVDDVVE